MDTPEGPEVVCTLGHKSPSSAKFCGECGEAFGVTRCPKGHVMPDSTTFCTECGEALKTPVLQWSAPALGPLVTGDATVPPDLAGPGAVPEISTPKRDDGMAEVLFTSAGGLMLFGVSSDPPLYGIWFKAKPDGTPIATWPLEGKQDAEAAWARRAPNAEAIEPPRQDLWLCPPGYSGTYSVAAASPTPQSQPSSRKRSQSQQSSALEGITVVVGLVGLLLAIWGLVIHFHNSSLSSNCSSALGQLGQSADLQAVSMCSHWSAMSDLGIVMAIIGVLALSFAAKLVIAVAAGTNHPVHQTRTDPTRSRESPFL